MKHILSFTHEKNLINGYYYYYKEGFNTGVIFNWENS